MEVGHKVTGYVCPGFKIRSWTDGSMGIEFATPSVDIGAHSVHLTEGDLSKLAEGLNGRVVLGGGVVEVWLETMTNDMYWQISSDGWRTTIHVPEALATLLLNEIDRLGRGAKGQEKS